MTIKNFISISPKRVLGGLISIGLVVAIGAACNDTTALSGPDTNRIYVQIERLGNPLVSGWPRPLHWIGARRIAASCVDAASMPTSG